MEIDGASTISDNNLDVFSLNSVGDPCIAAQSHGWPELAMAFCDKARRTKHMDQCLVNRTMFARRTHIYPTAEIFRVISSARPWKQL